MKKYIAVEWPDYQIFMDHPKFDKCCYSTRTNTVLMIPEEIYNEVLGNNHEQHDR